MDLQGRAPGQALLMNLTAHFSLEELTASETAARKGIDNTLPTELRPNIERLAHGLESIRLYLNLPIHVNSGYRCPELNRAVGGSKTSSHVLALAADIICPKLGDPLVLCRAIAGMPDLECDQIIYEYGPKGWAHVGFSPPSKIARHQLLTINSTSNGYQEGFLMA